MPSNLHVRISSRHGLCNYLLQTIHILTHELMERLQLRMINPMIISYADCSLNSLAFLLAGGYIVRFFQIGHVY